MLEWKTSLALINLFQMGFWEDAAAEFGGKRRFRLVWVPGC